MALRSDLLEQLQTALAGSYRVERELGRGAMATVYLAHDRAGNPVAFKLLHPDLASTVGAERFRREIRVAGRLQHPNILGVLDSGVATVSHSTTGKSLELHWFAMLRPVVQVPEHVETAIFRALAREPAERFASAHDFAAALSGTPVSSGRKRNHG